MIYRIGLHKVYEDGDIVTLSLHGDLALEDIQAVTEILDGVIARYGQFGVIGDLRELSTVTPEARRFAGAWRNVDHGYGVACFGSSFPVRTMVTLLSRAIELFRKRRHRGPLEFFKTEADARTWLLSQRQKASPPD